MSLSSSAFIAALQDKHKASGLSHTDFAQSVLNISPCFWSYIQHGRRGIGPRFIRNAFRAFPHTHAMDAAYEHSGCDACHLARALSYEFQSAA